VLIAREATKTLGMLTKYRYALELDTGPCTVHWSFFLEEYFGALDSGLLDVV